MSYPLRALTATLAISAIAGCATIVTGTTQPMTITSNVAGAQVLLDGLVIGTTPFSSPVPKNKTTLTVQKEGYQSFQLALSKSVEGAFWGNIILGGLGGSTTDMSTGAMYAYAPNTFQVDLKRTGETDNRFEQESELRRFAMLNVDKVSSDLARGEGEHLAALLALLNTRIAKPIAAGDVRAIVSSSHGDPFAFGRALVSLH